MFSWWRGWKKSIKTHSDSPLTVPLFGVPNAEQGRGMQESSERLLARSILYRFKRDVLNVVASMNQGVKHEDTEVLAEQTLFVQHQLLHSLYHDATMPQVVRSMLFSYHSKCIKARMLARRQRQAQPPRQTDRPRSSEPRQNPGQSTHFSRV